MPQRFQGLNINALSLTETDRAVLIALLKQMNAISHTVMDHWQFTVDCATAMPDTEWHHRSWNPFGIWDDTKTYLHVTPEQWAQRVHGFEKRPNIWHHMLNEPSNDDVPRLIDWLIEAMNLTGEHGKYPTRCIVGNLAVDKSFQHIGDSIKYRDDWLRLFRAFEAHDGWHRLGVHRYWIGDVRLAYVGGYPANIRRDYPQHKDYLDSTKHHLKLERLSNGHLPPHWTGYADMWAWQLCIEHGIQIPYIVETEGIHDEKRDPGTAPYTEYVDKTYPTGYNDGRARGTWTWKKWSEASSGLPYIEQLKAQINARTRVHLQLERDYPQFKGRQRGAHWFSYTKAFDWTKAGFSLYFDPLGDDLIQAMIDAPLFVETAQENPMPEPIPDYVMQRKLISTDSITNIRTLANEAGTVYLTLRAGEENDHLIARISNIPILNGKVGGVDYAWYKILIDGRTEPLWVAETKHLIITDAPPVPDEPEPEEPQPDLPDIEDMIHEVLAPLLKEVLVDVPFPDFTYTVPAFLKNYLISYHRNEARKHEAIARRIESGQPTLSQLATKGYAYNYTPFTDDDGKIDLSRVLDVDDDDDDDDMLLDTMLNSA